MTVSSTLGIDDDGVEVIEIRSIEPIERPADVPAWYTPGQIVRAIRARLPFLLLVVLPALLGAIYFLGIAANRYQTDARFVVKSPSSSAASQLSGLVGVSTVVRSSEDAYIAHAYFRSRDVVAALEREGDLLARLTRPEADFLWTYPGPFNRPSAERLWRHFQSFVSYEFDPATGITVLNVQAFRPEDAQAIAEFLLRKAEQLINSIGSRAQAEALEGAKREAEIARAWARETLEKVTEFRRRTRMIDPTRISASTLETLTTLAVEVARSKAELSELDLASPQSPQAVSLKRRIAAFEEQMEVERQALAGSDTTLAPLISEYERLVLEREFAERTFASAVAAQESARRDIERQRIFLERISSPAIVDYPMYPYRWLNMLLVLAGAYMVYSIATTFISDTLNHAGK